MDLTELLKIELFIKNMPSNLVDVTDRLHYVYTPIVFISSISILIMKNFILKPIFCTVPYEFTVTWEEYAQNYCWVQQTYNLLPSGSFPPENRKEYIHTSTLFLNSVKIISRNLVYYL